VAAKFYQPMPGELKMLNRVLNNLFVNIRTMVAAGVANAIKLGIADGVGIATEQMTLSLEGPDAVDDYELPELSVDDLLIE